MPTLVVVDDEPNVLYSLKKGLETDSLRVVTAETGEEGLERIGVEKPDVVILDVRLPDMSGLEVFDRLRGQDARLPVIVVTAYATTETAIDAMKRGAFEYLLKPVDLRELRSIVTRALQLSRLQNIPTVFDGEPYDERADRIVGQSTAMQEVYKFIGRVAAQGVPVLILGESGTGKELIARAIYHHSLRSALPFLAINCAAIPESLLESELFGHERGAFTGADQPRIGKFEQCHGGTIFLDEIGDMAPATQAKMLRLLQDGRFERVGGNETVETDVRVIAATNRDLEAMVAEGSFRLDLLYRLNVFTVRLPPLRDRLEDLPALVEHFLRVFNNQLGKQVRTLAPETMHCLRSHSWPGNVRELQSALKYALVHCVGEVLLPEFLPSACTGPATDQDLQPSNLRTAFDVVDFVRRLLQAGEMEVYRRVQTEVDRVIVREVLDHVRGNQVQASQLLGISRTTLRAKLGALALCDEPAEPGNAQPTGQPVISSRQ